jgi:hypothetical protein
MSTELFEDSRRFIAGMLYPATSHKAGLMLSRSGD